MILSKVNDTFKIFVNDTFERLITYLKRHFCLWRN